MRITITAANFNPAVASRHAEYDDNIPVPTLGPGTGPDAPGTQPGKPGPGAIF